MLDEDIINQIIERENREKRKDSGWQPVPLYKELEMPQYLPPAKEKSPPGAVEIDVWGPEVSDYIEVQTQSYYF